MPSKPPTWASLTVLIGLILLIWAGIVVASLYMVSDS